MSGQKMKQTKTQNNTHTTVKRSNKTSCQTHHSHITRYKIFKSYNHRNRSRKLIRPVRNPDFLFHFMIYIKKKPKIPTKQPTVKRSNTTSCHTHHSLITTHKPSKVTITEIDQENMSGQYGILIFLTEPSNILSSQRHSPSSSWSTGLSSRSESDESPSPKPIDRDSSLCRCVHGIVFLGW